jgi:hypothetical protein
MLPYYYHDWQDWIPHEVEVVQGVTGPEDRVITVTLQGATTLLYHLHRPGWVIDYTDAAQLARVPQYLTKDAHILILQDLEYKEARALPAEPWLAGLALIEQGERYQIYRVP